MRLDLSCNPSNPLWAGCEFSEVGGRFNMTTDLNSASNSVGRNVAASVKSFEGDRSVVTLTGPAPVWAHLVAFHQVVHVFGRVEYDDGRNPAFPIAAH